MLLATAMLLGFFTTAADNFRCVTVAATDGSPTTLQIQPGETAELISSVSTAKNGTVQITFLKGSGGGGPWDFGMPVIGPATITVISSRNNTAIITVRITSESVDLNKADSIDVNKTLILPPSTNQVYVALESSTNPVNWAAATNNFRYVTIAATFGGATTVQIQQGETVELVSSVSTAKNGTGQTTFFTSSGGSGTWGFGIPLTGPATITASASRGNTLLITVKITSESVDLNRANSIDVNKTLILPPSTNQVYVALEFSTNLVNWAAATNGFYGSPDTVRFFRIRTNALASP